MIDETLKKNSLVMDLGRVNAGSIFLVAQIVCKAIKKIKKKFVIKSYKSI